MKKIALVNQRFGEEVNGGSEYYTMLLAGQLKKNYDIEVLTTRAVDYLTWDNYYPEGLQEVNGLKVRRFSVDKIRNLRKFNYINRAMQLFKFHKFEEYWLKEQGPFSTGCINYIKENEKKYDVFIFVTYLYYLTVKGLPQVADKAILIPTAHDEFCIYFNIYKKIFFMPKAIIYLTEEEKYFVQKMLGNREVVNDVIGIGVDSPNDVDGKRFCDKYNIKNQYIVYAGRIDVGKGCGTLFEYFIKYKDKNKDLVKLVLMGKKAMNIPMHPDIIYVGYVTKGDKFDGISGARALVLPSVFESLSIAVLESMSLGVPIVVNGNSDVLKGHCIKSKGGLYYHDYCDFESSINDIMTNNKTYNNLCINAKHYIDNNYQWNLVMEKLENIIEKV